MTPLERAVDAACRAYVLRNSGADFDELPAIQKYHIREYITGLIAPAVTAYEEAKREHGNPA